MFQITKKLMNELENLDLDSRFKVLDKYFIANIVYVNRTLISLKSNIYKVILWKLSTF